MLKKKIKEKFNNIKLYLATILFGVVAFTPPVYAVNKIEGGDITIDSLGKIIKNLATQIQIFGVIIAFIALIIFVIQFIIGDDDTKQRKKRTIIYTLIGVALLILVPSIINFIIDTLD